MKRNLLKCAFRVLLMAPALSSTPASSALPGITWVAIGSNDQYTAYASGTVVQKKDGVVEMWTLNDYKVFRRSMSGRPYMSKKYQGEYDCTNRRYRIIYATTHDEPMGRGSIRTYYTEPDPWMAAPKGSFEGYVLDRACGRR
jgi:hypothetical protein